jgi:effector-binding domain-containing protein
LRKVLYGVSGIIAVLVVVGLALPRHARVEVTTRISARPATVFALVNDFHRVSLWSPLLETDPNARVIYSGPVRGVGATMRWDGGIIGSGSQTIIASRAFDHVATVINPGTAAAARTWFDLTPDDDGTSVVWGFESDYGFNLVGRYFAPMFAGIVRRDYAIGLANLRELAESLPAADFSDLEIEAIVVEPAEIAYLSTTAKPEPAAISAAMSTAYFQILTFIDAENLQEAGAPLSITKSFRGSELLFDAAIPVRGVTESTPRDGATVKLGFTYGGPVIRVKHIGSYRSLAMTHGKITAYLAALGIERADPPWEAYVSDPTQVAEEELLTLVYYPVRQQQ